MVPLDISEEYAGSVTVIFMTEDTSRTAQFTPRYSVLFEKGLNVQDSLLQYKVTARILPIVRSKR